LRIGAPPRIDCSDSPTFIAATSICFPIIAARTSELPLNGTCVSFTPAAPLEHEHQEVVVGLRPSSDGQAAGIRGAPQAAQLAACSSAPQA